MIDTPEDLVLRITEEDNGIRCPLSGVKNHPIVTRCVHVHTCGEIMAWNKCLHCKQTWPIEIEPVDFVMAEYYQHPYDDRRRVPYR